MTLATRIPGSGVPYCWRVVGSRDILRPEDLGHYGCANQEIQLIGEESLRSIGEGLVGIVLFDRRTGGLQRTVLFGTPALIQSTVDLDSHWEQFARAATAVEPGVSGNGLFLDTCTCGTVLALGFRSVLGVPLNYKQENLGAIICLSRQTKAALAEKVDTLRSVARLGAASVGKSQREGDVYREITELASLADASSALTGLERLRQLADEVIVRVTALSNARRGGILFVDSKAQEVVTWHISRVVPGSPSDNLTASATSWGCRLLPPPFFRGLVVCNDPDAEALGRHLMEVVGPLHNFVAVPIRLTADACDGILYVADRIGADFSDDDALLLTFFVNSLVSALRDAQLRSDLRRQQKQVTAFGKTVAEISAQLELDRVLESIAHRARELMETDSAYIALRDEDSDCLYMRVCVGITTEAFQRIKLERGQGLGGLVLQTQQPAMIRDYRESEHLHDPLLDVVLGEGIRSKLAVPLKAADTVIGVLYVSNREPTTFSSTQVDLLSTLANHAAIAIENARLYESEKRTVLQLQELNRAVDNHLGTLKRTLDIHNQFTQIVLDGKGKKAVTRTLANLVGRPVAVLNRLGQVVAQAFPGGLDGPAWTPEIATAVLAAIADNPDARSQPQVISVPQQSGRGIANVPDDAISILLKPIIAAREFFGHVIVIQNGQRLDQYYEMTVEQAATVLAIEMLRDKTAYEVELRLRGDFLDDLLAGSYEDERTILDRAALLGYDLTMPHYLLIVNLDDPRRLSESNQLDETAALRLKEDLFGVVSDTVIAEFPKSAVIGKGYSTIVLAALPPPRQQDATKQIKALAKLLRHKIAVCLGGATASVALGGECHSLSDYREAHRIARKTLDVLRSIGWRDRDISFEELGLYRLLSLVDRKDELRAFATQILGNLDAYDAKHNSELVKTLRAYLQNNCSQKLTAEALFVHPNTLAYRLKRIEEIGGVDLGNAADLLDLELAFKIRSLEVLSAQA